MASPPLAASRPTVGDVRENRGLSRWFGCTLPPQLITLSWPMIITQRKRARARLGRVEGAHCSATTTADEKAHVHRRCTQKIYLKMVGYIPLMLLECLGVPTGGLQDGAGAGAGRPEAGSCWPPADRAAPSRWIVLAALQAARAAHPEALRPEAAFHVALPSIERVVIFLRVHGAPLGIER